MGQPLLSDTPPDRAPAGGDAPRVTTYGIAICALILALGAVALSGWTALRSSTEESAVPIADEQSRVEGQRRICDAFTVVRQGVSLNTNLEVPGRGGDPAAGMSVAANARLALFGEGEYLLARLDMAAPSELRDATRSLADALLDIGPTSIAGVPTTDPAQAQRLRSAEDLSTRVADLCGRS